MGVASIYLVREFAVFLGPSGCGKTATLKMIAGLEDITRGEIYIDGKLVNKAAPKDRDIAMIFRVMPSIIDPAQGSNSVGCPIPADELFAAYINLVAVSPTGEGNLQAFPVGAGTGAGLSVNYNAIDTNLANAGTVKTISGTGADIKVASNFSSAHTVIDVLGYYYSSP